MARRARPPAADFLALPGQIPLPLSPPPPVHGPVPRATFWDRLTTDGFYRRRHELVGDVAPEPVDAADVPAEIRQALEAKAEENRDWLCRFHCGDIGPWYIYARVSHGFAWYLRRGAQTETDAQDAG